MTKEVFQSRLDRLAHLMGVERKTLPLDMQAAMGQIPCAETSDPEKLCASPLVSVSIVTYNHEPWIAQAIESVLTQECDFAFELVLAEDCSTDRTREICLDYQRRYPHIIRVLHSGTNLGSAKNMCRAWIRLRGEYVCPFEGDDYWTDRRKLQKQVALLRKHPDANLCVGFVKILHGGATEPAARRKPPRAKERLTFRDLSADPLTYHTSTRMFTRAGLQRICAAGSPVVLVDTPILLIASHYGAVVQLPEYLSVYRRSGLGICSGAGQLARVRLFMRVAVSLASFFYPAHRYHITQRLYKVVIDFLCMGGNGLSRAEQREALGLALSLVGVPAHRIWPTFRLAFKCLMPCRATRQGDGEE